MARSLDSASSTGGSRCIFSEVRSVRLVFGRSGVFGHGMAMFISAQKDRDVKRGVVRKLCVFIAVAGCIGVTEEAAVSRSAGWTLVSSGVMGLCANLSPNSFWSSNVGDFGRSVGCVVSNRNDGVHGGETTFALCLAEVLGELLFVLFEETMMRGEAERARGEVWRMCFGRGGRGRFIGGGGDIRGMLFFEERWHGRAAGTYFVAGS